MEEAREGSAGRTRARSAARRWALAALFACMGCSEAPLAHLPARSGLNVVVVSFDALRADALGAYGYPRRTSPNIDRMARQAVLFENAYSAAPVTPTSFAAAFTGRLPHRSFRNWRLVGTSLAELFAEAGYTTAAFMNNAHLAAARGFDRGFGTYEIFQDTESNAPEIFERAGAWLDGEAHDPFLVWIHWIDPHTPWVPHPEAGHLYDETGTVPAEPPSGLTFKVHDPAELRRLRSLYDGEVFACDALFDRVVSLLRERGLLDRTLVVLTSDHGEEFMQHGWLQHGQLNEENLHIPWILLHPDQAGALRVPDLVSQLDFLPTLAGLAGLDVPEGLDGRDLRRRGGDLDPLLAVAYTSARFQQASIRTGGRKLIAECGSRVRRGTHAPVQLYDLVRDPAETRNLAGVRAEEAERLERRLWDALGMTGCADLRMRDPDEPDREFEGLDEEALRQLEALGYIDR